MKKFITFLGLMVFFSACTSEPANESDFVEFWETSDFLTYVGTETVSGEYLLTTLYELEFYPDEDSLSSIPPTHLEGERYFLFDLTGEQNFREALGIGFDDVGCSYEGTATIEIVDYAVSKQEGAPDEVIFSEVIESTEPELLLCEVS